jgi:hypothetical protein
MLGCACCRYTLHGMVTTMLLSLCTPITPPDLPDLSSFVLHVLLLQITTLITVAVILSLSVVIGERLKDTSVSGSVMTIKGSTQPIQVGLSRQYRWGYLGNTQGRHRGSAEAVQVQTTGSSRQPSGTCFNSSHWCQHLCLSGALVVWQSTGPE